MTYDLTRRENQLRQLIDNVFLTIGNSLQKRRIKDLRIPTTHLVNNAW